MWDSSEVVSGRADGATTPIPQYTAVYKTGTNDYYDNVATADSRIDGVIQLSCTKDAQSITVVKAGRTKAIAGGVLDEGDPITTDASGRMVEAKGTATVTSGANTSLDYTETDAGRGKVKSVSYVDPGMANHTGYVENLGGNIVAHLTTNGGGAISETADTLKTLLAAHAEIAALVTAADTAGHDGSGTLTAEPAVPFTGAQNICGRALQSASGAGSEIDVWLEGRN